MKLKKTITSLVLIGGLLGSGATAAFAAISYPGGGVWNYGTGGGIVWSDYYHGSKTHRSSVDGAYYYSSPWTSAGYWSIADAPDTSGVDYSYWDTW
jgi:lactococcin 972 family bacteriocin